jgi:hypothetical protein
MPKQPQEISAPKHPAFERHYRIGELADMWKLGRETVRLLVRNEDGVIKVRLGRKKAHTTYSVPESVAVRIHTRLMNPSTQPPPQRSTGTGQVGTTNRPARSRR